MPKNRILVPCCSVLCLVAQSCLTLCDPMDCSPPGSSVHGDSSSKDTGVGCHSHLQAIFPIQRSNPGLPQFRQILYQLSPPGKPKYIGAIPTQELTWGLLHCRQILYSWATREIAYHQI